MVDCSFKFYKFTTLTSANVQPIEIIGNLLIHEFFNSRVFDKTIKPTDSSGNSIKQLNVFVKVEWLDTQLN